MRLNRPLNFSPAEQVWASMISLLKDEQWEVGMRGSDAASGIRGVGRVAFQFVFAMAAYNLIRNAQIALDRRLRPIICQKADRLN